MAAITRVFFGQSRLPDFRGAAFGHQSIPVALPPASDSVHFSGKLSNAKKIEIGKLCLQLNIPAPNSPAAWGLLDRALTHPSVSKTRLQSNQRLEFLGDGVLTTVAREYTMKRYGRLNEGQLNQLYSILTCNAALFEMGRMIGLEKYMHYSADLTSPKSRAKMVADGMEALLGALYLGDNGNARNPCRVMFPLFRRLMRQIPVDRLQEYRTDELAHALWGESNPLA